VRHDVIEGVTGIAALQSDPRQQLRGANRDMSTAEQATEHDGGKAILEYRASAAGCLC
jgi:hypothetical protein